MTINQPGRLIKRLFAGYSFNRYKEIFDKAGYAIMLIDKRTNNFIRVNQTASDLFGYSQDELRKMTPLDLSTQGESTYRIKESVGKENVVRSARRKDGTIITVKVQTSYSDRFYLCLVSDVTEEYRIRRALELNQERLREAQRIGQFGWWEFRPETGRYYVSDELFEIYNDELFAPSFTYHDHLSNTHPEDRSYVRTIIEEAIEKKQESYSLSYRVITRTGKIKTVAINAHNKYDETGKLLSRYGTVQDVTETQKIMNELIAARRHAEESDRLKTAFLANFSHEIRTPLNAMMGFINILTSMKTSDKERDEMLSLIDTNSQRLLRLINDMIDLSRIESNNLEIKYTNVEINSFLSSMKSSVNCEQASAGKRDLKISLVKDDDSQHVYQYIDELRLSQIFNNLLNNALKFTEKGEITYGYNVTRNMNKTNITYFVKDTGPGISPEKHKDIFKPFVQFWSEEKPKVQGAGLGLAICSRMTELMKGQIWVDSSEGKGSAFYFSFNTPVSVE